MFKWNITLPSLSLEFLLLINPLTSGFRTHIVTLFDTACECVCVQNVSKTAVWQILCSENSSGGDDDDDGARDGARQDKPLKYLRVCQWKSGSKLRVKQLNTKQKMWVAMVSMLGWTSTRMPLLPIHIFENDQFFFRMTSDRVCC